MVRGCRVALLILGGLSSAFAGAACEIIAGIEDLSVADGGASGGSSSGSNDDGSTTTGGTNSGTSGASGTGGGGSSGTTSSGGTDGAADDAPSSSTGGLDGGGSSTSSSSSSSSGTTSSSGSTSSSTSSSGIQTGDGGGWVDMTADPNTACENKTGTPCGWATTNNGLGYTCLCYNGNFAVPWGCELPHTCVTLGPACPTSSGAPICPADAGQ